MPWHIATLIEHDKDRGGEGRFNLSSGNLIYKSFLNHLPGGLAPSVSFLVTKKGIEPPFLSFGTRREIVPNRVSNRLTRVPKEWWFRWDRVLPCELLLYFQLPVS
jgi:hypothetical protein